MKCEVRFILYVELLTLVSEIFSHFPLVQLIWKWLSHDSFYSKLSHYLLFMNNLPSPSKSLKINEFGWISNYLSIYLDVSLLINVLNCKISGQDEAEICWLSIIPEIQTLGFKVLRLFHTLDSLAFLPYHLWLSH